MSDLTHVERRLFEKLFVMGGGYVLNFCNRTFEDFVLDSTGKNIYDSKYNNFSGSKANRLRAFWSDEPNYVVAKLLGDLVEHAVEMGVEAEQEPILENCRRVVNRLSESAAVTEIDAITPNSPERDFSALAKSVKEAIERNEPETGLDRLHTFVMKYMRVLSSGHGILADRNTPLHSLVGQYVKCLKEKNAIESEMTERILKSAISTLEAFNRVRNDQSFAHDNRILNYDESLLIFNHVASTIRFIQAVERRLSSTVGTDSSFDEDDIPF